MFDVIAKLWQYVEIENSSSGINPFLSLSNNSIAWSFYPDVDIMLFDPILYKRKSEGGNIGL